ncbi:MAG: AAC(3) family N-acetyltransferase [Alphaproteobacteria bacterium]|nr:AAC(3) family N-acetyltransferase [Alphaproteobacteria bacterium]
MTLPFTRAQLIADLRRLGLGAGDLVMVHASVRSVGAVLGGPDEIHQAIVDAVSPGGTMAMLLGCPNGYDDVGRGIHTPEEEAQILAHMPAFDKHATRANYDVGALAEMFRTWPGTKVSDSVAVRIGARGARADWFVAEHPQTWPFGRGTPFEKLVENGGKVLLLGSDHDEVTLLHYAESIADFPDKIVRTFSVPVMQDGRRVWVTCQEFDSSAGAHRNWSERQFAEIVDDFIGTQSGTPACAKGKVGNSESYLLGAKALVDHAIAIMVRIATGEAP